MTHRRQVERAIMESRGFEMKVEGLRTSGKYSELADPAKKKGVLLPPFLGVPDSCTRKEEIKEIVKELPITLAPRPSLPFSVLYDRPSHQKLRSRLILNRASGLAAVYHYHNRKDPSPAIRQCPFCFERGVSTPETVQHAIAQCVKYEEERKSLLLRLKDTIKLIEDRLRSNNRMAEIMSNADSILTHIVLATPFVVESLNSFKMRIELLELTGQFIDHINSIKRL
jgi:hypothetical protein